MAIYKTVIKAGQVWSNKYSGTYKITRVGKSDAQGISRVYAVQIQDGVEDLERHFGYVNEDGTPFQWDVGWKCEEPEPSFDCKPKTYQSDLDFFKAVAPGRCPCDIAKVDCWIHR